MAENPAKLPESIYQTVLNAMEHGYVFMTPDSVIRTFNDAACRILGLSADQLLGKATTDRDWGTIREDGSEFPPHQHPITVSLRTEKPCYGVVMGIRVGVDQTRWLLINSDVVCDPETGEVAGSVATFADITHQIKQKIYLEESLEDLKSSTRASAENMSYLTSTLLSLVNEIAAADKDLLASMDADKAAARECASLIARKAEKLAALLSQSHI